MYVKVTNGVPTPITKRAVKAANPNVSFPSEISDELLAAYGIHPVVSLPDPSFNPLTERLVKGTPVNNGGTWEVTQVVEALSPEEVARLAKEAEQEEDKNALKTDAEVVALLKARPTAINNYINNNVSNLAEAKNVLKILARAVAVLAQRTL